MARAALLPVALLLCLALAGTADAERKEVRFYELKMGALSIKVTNWGATLVKVLVPDRKGNVADVILGYDTLGGYLNGTASFGATVGRVANRIANSSFVLDGKTYNRLYKNDGNNSIHGGHRGFSKVIWTVKEYVPDCDSPYITFFYHSFDGEQGFPGELDVYVTYRLSSANDLSISMNATATSKEKDKIKATPVNIVNHAYWNLAGHDSGDILDHELQILASRYTPLDETKIPTGKIEPVAGTIFDFLKPTPVGEHMEVVAGGGGGYDINFAVDGQQDALRKVALVKDPKSGRGMEVWANQPGVQLYTSNWVKNEKGKGGKVYQQYGALCLETQAYPDAVNHPEFPSTILRPGQEYKHDMIIKFSNLLGYTPTP